VPVPALTTSGKKATTVSLTDAATTKTSLNKFEKFKAEKDGLAVKAELEQFASLAGKQWMKLIVSIGSWVVCLSPSHPGSL